MNWQIFAALEWNAVRMWGRVCGNSVLLLHFMVNPKPLTRVKSIKTHQLREVLLNHKRGTCEALHEQAHSPGHLMAADSRPTGPFHPPPTAHITVEPSLVCNGPVTLNSCSGP